MLIATLPPYVSHRQEIVEHPRVDALRFNTIMPLAADKPTVLRQLLRLCGDKPLWLDLKTRQLRVTRFAYMPYAFVELSHRISVEVPTPILFGDGAAVIREVVDGNKLILEDRPPRVVGEGQPVNILDPSLKIEGFLTGSDREWIEAARAEGQRRFMLSFVEQRADLDELRASIPDAEVVAKIESKRGLEFVARDYPALRGEGVHLMAARDDLYLNMGDEPLDALDGVEAIVKADPEAIAASRILSSLEENERPTYADLADLELLRRMGYRRLMLSDGLCFRRSAWRRAAPLLDAYLARAESRGA